MIDRVLNELAVRRETTGYTILLNENYVVKLDANRPIIVSFYARKTGDMLLGDPDGQEPVFTIYGEQENRELKPDEDNIKVAYRAIHDRTSSCYHTMLARNGTPAVELDVTFTLSKDDLVVSFDRIVEHQGYKLMRVDINRVLSAHSSLKSSRMAIGSYSGRLIDPSKCCPGSCCHKYNWIKEAFGVTGLVYGTDLTAVLILDSLDDMVLSSVGENTAGSYAGLGVEFLYRYPSTDPSAQFTPGKSNKFRLHLIESNTGSPEKGWVIGARYLRSLQCMPPPDIYKDTFIYKIWLGSPRSLVETTFDQALEIIKSIHNLTDGVKQVAYLVGFQHDGHDTGYPDVYKVNEHVGGREKLLELIREAEKFNTIVSLHDNYDDAYDTSPSWDPEIIAIDKEGELLKGGVWNGSQAFWTSMPVYVRTKSKDRIKRTLEHYPIKETYHLDVLTASVFRIDYRSDSPAGKDADLKARLELVDQFRKKGIDISSEGCGLPFIGYIRYFWGLPRWGEEIYEGDRRIPLAAFIAHGNACYGGSSADSYGIIDGLLYGSFYSRDIRASTPISEVIDAFYLLQTPLNLLRAECMMDYEAEGTRRRVTYTNDSFIEVDYETLQHQVCFQGRTIVKNFASFAPSTTTEGAYLFYRARFGPPPQWKLPEEWKDVKTVKAVALTASGEEEEHQIEVENGMITFALQRGVPFKVTPGDQ